MPEIVIKQQRKFSDPSDYNAFCVVRMHNSVLGSLGGRNAWVAIRSAARAVAYRTIRGSGQTPVFPTDGMELDYETSSALGISKAAPLPSGMFPCALKARPATRWERLIAHWNHPDEAYRFPLQLSLVGLLLGDIGLVLGVPSLL